MEAVLSTIKRHRLSEAVPLQPARHAPGRLDAQGRGRVSDAQKVCRNIGRDGRKRRWVRRRVGENFSQQRTEGGRQLFGQAALIHDLQNAAPQTQHAQQTDRQCDRVVGAGKAAVLTASMVPLTMPNTTEITIIAVKIQAIAIVKPPQ